jgi:hypothetical protein
MITISKLIINQNIIDIIVNWYKKIKEKNFKLK